MTFSFAWDDDDNTVMRYAAEGSWNWNDFHRNVRRSMLAFDTLDHPVEAIFDLSGGDQLPAGAISHIRSITRLEHVHRTPRAVVVGVPAPVQARLGAENGVYRSRDGTIRFVDTLDAARQVIAAWRAESI